MTRVESAKAAVETTRAGVFEVSKRHIPDSEVKKVLDAYACAVAELAVAELAGEQSAGLAKHEEHMREAARRPFAGTVGSLTCAIISAELDRLRARVRELDTPIQVPAGADEERAK